MTNLSWEMAIAMYMAHLNMTREEAKAALGINKNNQGDDKLSNKSMENEVNSQELKV
ncbi:hypothetical protein [Vibrio marisflavi]|uniref:Uncharacterized protein n=1 Tax=Vibrio marisflavi CECT 7928 TaxID=634439 RepID=A0ABN8E4U7_9VIBR|nr:hypothetical protein [Vibrio marisflavi]CAH0537092.1 hypothetical protein VMF7928_00928 [Vibrio marisflavi CECT 7928]